MNVAARAGLPTAKVRVRHFARHETLIVERFDRTPQGKRIHQEDFAQALGTVAKYQQYQGPTLRECFTNTGVGVWPLWEQVMFAWLIGYEDHRARVTPLKHRNRFRPHEVRNVRMHDTHFAVRAGSAVRVGSESTAATERTGAT